MGQGVPILNGDATPETRDGTNFGSVSLGTAPITHIFTISNSGAGALVLSGSPAVALSQGTQFSVTTQPASPVASNLTVTFDIAFAPSAAGSFTDTVHIANNDTDETPYTFVISGTGADVLCHVRLNDSPNAYPTVQAAIDAAQDGDTVKVAGTCTGVESRGGFAQTAYISKSITLRGGYTTTDWTMSNPVSYPTTLDAQEQGRVVLISGDVTPTIEGFLITGGRPSSGSGGGIRANNAHPIIANVIISGNTTIGASGGGICFSNADRAQVLSSTIQNNHVVYNGAGVFAYNGSGNLYFQNVQVLNNRTTGGASGDGGGGLALRDDLVTLRDVVIRGNSSGNKYGGAEIFSDGAELYNVVIENNTASSHHGGLYVNGNDAVLFSVMVVSNSTALDSGGLYVSSPRAVLTYVHVLSNTAGQYHGGLHFIGQNAILDQLTLRGNHSTHANTDGGGVRLEDFDNSVLRRSLIIDNYTPRNGGGVFVVTAHNYNYRLENNIIANNRVGPNSDVSGVYLKGDGVQLVHNTIVSNTGGTGQAVYLESGEGAVLTNNIIMSHTYGLGVGAGYTLTAFNNVLWGNTTLFTGTVISQSNALCNPAFVDSNDRDYQLSDSSCAIDAGAIITTVATDFEGDPRPMGAGYDIGADEYTRTHIISPTYVVITGPADGLVNIPYTFTATVNPTVTLPLTYAWQIGASRIMHHASRLTHTITFTWTKPGLKPITVTARNRAGSVIATTTVEISNPPPPPPPPLDAVTIHGPTSGAVNTRYVLTAAVRPITAVTVTVRAPGVPQV
jgi:hypothetical protein